MKLQFSGQIFEKKKFSNIKSQDNPSSDSAGCLMRTDNTKKLKHRFNQIFGEHAHEIFCYDSFFPPLWTNVQSSSVHSPCEYINLLKPTSHVMHQQFNIQQLYVLPTLYLCVLCLSENKQWLVPLTA